MIKKITRIIPKKTIQKVDSQAADKKTAAVMR